MPNKKRPVAFRTDETEVGSFYYYRHRVVAPHLIDGELLQASGCLFEEIGGQHLPSRYERLEGELQLTLPEGVGYGGVGPLAHGINMLAVLLPNGLEVHLEHRDGVIPQTSRSGRHIALVLPEKGQCQWPQAMQQRPSFLLDYYRSVRPDYQARLNEPWQLDEEIVQSMREWSSLHKTDLLLLAKEVAAKHAPARTMVRATKEELLTFLVFISGRSRQSV